MTSLTSDAMETTINASFQVKVNFFLFIFCVTKNNQSEVEDSETKTATLENPASGNDPVWTFEWEMKYGYETYQFADLDDVASKAWKHLLENVSLPSKGMKQETEQTDDGVILRVSDIDATWAKRLIKFMSTNKDDIGDDMFAKMRRIAKKSRKSKKDSIRWWYPTVAEVWVESDLRVISVEGNVLDYDE
jgi:hypothetical protein